MAVAKAAGLPEGIVGMTLDDALMNRVMSLNQLLH